MKVHFAGNQDHCGDNLLPAGVRYRLESYYDISRRGGGDGVDTWNRFRHTIIDSGLFTLMFGSDSKTVVDAAFCEDWYKGYIGFINASPFVNASFVEMDVQKKLGVEEAWELRRRMKADINKGTVINVYHLEDENPDKLIDFADYIAISIPELRFAVSDKERMQITKYIATKAKLKGKRVHLLGCTEIKYLKAFPFCDTCDSTSWQSSFRYGSCRTKSFGSVHIKQIRAHVGGIANATNDVFWSAYFCLQDYKKYAGPQD